jgi:hypothetical protein
MNLPVSRQSLSLKPRLGVNNTSTVRTNIQRVLGSIAYQSGTGSGLIEDMLGLPFMNQGQLPGATDLSTLLGI